MKIGTPVLKQHGSFFYKDHYLNVQAYDAE